MTVKPTGNLEQDLGAASRLLEMGRPKEAEKLLVRLAKKAPKDPDVHNFLGLALKQQGNLGKARVHFQKALKLSPKSAGLMVNLALLLKAEGKFAKAEDLYRKALSLSPDLAIIYVNLGVVLADQRRYDEAVEVYEAGLSKSSNSPEMLVNLAEALSGMDETEKAEERYKEALELAPQHVKALVGYGTMLKNLKRFDEAESLFKRAVSLAPDSMEVRNNYGVMLQVAGRVGKAETHLAEAVRLSGGILQMHLNHASAIKETGRVDEALEIYENLLNSGKETPELISNYLFTLNYSDRLTAEQITEAHCRWGGRLGARKKTARHRPAAPAIAGENRGLRIGYVSHDFKRHSVANFIRPVLREHDRDSFEVFAYSTTRKPDEVTQSIADVTDRWFDAGGLSDAELAEKVVEDQIDILVDLGGHTGHNRLAVFANRAAPLQTTWIGYPNTTGVAEMDVRLVDALTDPEEASYDLGSEALVRLPGCFLCYEPTMTLPDVAEPPFRKNGHVTFGCFNNLAKMQPNVLRLWGELMGRVPDSRLLFKGKPFVDSSVQERILRLMGMGEKDRHRIEFRGYEQSQEGHLAVYNTVDIALDTFPYNGTTTTCEALIMGVPVIGLSGDRHAARVGLSLLSAAGVPELVADTPQDYLAIAAALSEDRDRLAAYRSELRGKLQTSPLMDAKGFVARYEETVKALFMERQAS